MHYIFASFTTNERRGVIFLKGGHKESFMIKAIMEDEMWMK